MSLSRLEELELLRIFDLLPTRMRFGFRTFIPGVDLSLFPAWEKYVLEVRNDMVDDVFAILRDQIEGPGELLILSAPDSNTHEGQYKFTAIADGGRGQRISRLENELLTPLEVVYAFTGIQRRLAAERHGLQKLRSMYRVSGSKWFEGEVRAMREIARVSGELGR